MQKKKLGISQGVYHEVDGVSPYGDIPVEIKVSGKPVRGKLRHAQLAEKSEAYLLILGKKSAKRRILAIADAQFCNEFIRTMQAEATKTLGIEIKLCDMQNGEPCC